MIASRARRGRARPGASGPVWAARAPSRNMRAPQSPEQYSILVREAPGQRDEDRAEPLAGPEELHRLAAVSGTAAMRSPAVEAEPAGEPRAARAQGARSVTRRRRAPRLRACARRRRGGSARGSRRAPRAPSDRLHDRLVARAAAEMAREQILDLVARRRAPRSRKSVGGHQDAGVQKPHWSAWRSWKASWSGFSSPSPARPSTVSISRRRPGRRAAGTSAPRRRRGARCRRRRRRARSRRACR